MLVDLSMIGLYLVLAFMTMSGSMILWRDVKNSGISYDYLVCMKYENDEESATRSEYFTRLSIMDASKISMMVFTILLMSNLWGLADMHTLSLIATVVLTLSWLILRMVDLLAFWEYSWRMILLLTIDLQSNVLMVALGLYGIEIVSNLFRTLSLGFRLFANIFSGHLILVMFMSIECFMVYAGWTLSAILLYGLCWGLTGLEIFMSMVQAYVFTALSTIYLSEIV